MIEERILRGQARRQGMVVCDRVRAVVRTDGLRRHVTVQFLSGLAPALRDELERLTSASGHRRRDLAETTAPVDLELSSPRGAEVLADCVLGSPVQRHAPLEETEFRMRLAPPARLDNY